MSNEFYVNGDTLVGGTTANAADVKAEFDAIQSGFDKLPTEAQLKSGNLNYAVDSGAADAYVVTMPQTWTAYTAGWHLVMKVTNANTGASTVNVDGLGVKSIKKTDGSALVAGDLVAGALVTLGYDGTNFQVLNAVQGVVDAAENARDAAQTAQAAAETAQSAAETAQSNAETAETNAGTEVTYAAEWAVKAEDSLISVAAGGDGSTDYSAYHWAQKAEGWAQTTQWQTGDIIYTADTANHTTPTWLPCDGSAYSNTTYSSLAAVLPKTFAAVADPATMPSSTVNAVCFSGDSAYMGVTYNTKARVYTVSGTTVTALAELTADTGAYPEGCSLSSGGTYFAVACPNVPRLRIFKNTADVYSELSSPLDVTMSGTGYECAFSPDDTYLAASTSTTFYVFKRSGDAFTSLSVPAISGRIYDMAWSSDGNHLALAHSSSPYVTILSRSGDTFTKLADPATLPNGTVWRLCWDDDNSTIFWGSQSSLDDYFGMWHVSGSTLTNGNAPDVLPEEATGSATYARGLVFDNTTNRLIFANAANPSEVIIYEFDGTDLTYLGAYPTLDEDTASIYHAAISDDDEYIVFGGETQTIQVQKKGYILPDIADADTDYNIKPYIKTGE